MPYIENLGMLVADYWIDHRLTKTAPPFAVKTKTDCAFSEMAEPVVTLDCAIVAVKERYQTGFSDGYDKGLIENLAQIAALTKEIMRLRAIVEDKEADKVEPHKKE